ncbi:MAG: hypothetical protein Q7S81_03075 [bacterium]|nr:hypothetical protein [bacterium]
MKFKIIRGDGVDTEIVKELEEETVQKAKETAAKYLTGDGLPCAGSMEDTYSLIQAEGNAQIFKFTAQEIWQTHKFLEGLKLLKKKE